MTYSEIQKCLVSRIKNKPIENQPCKQCKHYSEFKRTGFTCGVSCVDFKMFEEEVKS